jgi:hypothetical protein
MGAKAVSMPVCADSPHSDDIIRAPFGAPSRPHPAPVRAATEHRIHRATASSVLAQHERPRTVYRDYGPHRSGHRRWIMASLACVGQRP